jgi:hypothetical protein
MFLRITRYVLLIHRHHLRCMQPENRLERARAVASCAKSEASAVAAAAPAPSAPCAAIKGRTRSGWTLARAHAAATPAAAYKAAVAFPWLVRAAPFCAKVRGLHSAPAAARDSAMCSHTALSRACCSFTHLRLAPSPWLPFCVVPSHASAVCLASAFAGSGRRCPWACAWRGRNGSQVRLPGTALWYGSQVRLFGTAPKECIVLDAGRLAHPRPFPRPYKRAFTAHNHAHLPRTRQARTLELSKHLPSQHPRTF